MRRVYLIDLENVQSAGLDGVDQLTEEDSIFIFYSDKADNLKIDLVMKIQESPARVKFIKANNGTPNALDFQLISYLFYHLDENTQYWIVSKDTGYDAAIKMSKRMGLMNVRRAPAIKNAVHYGIRANKIAAYHAAREAEKEAEELLEEQSAEESAAENPMKTIEKTSEETQDEPELSEANVLEETEEEIQSAGKSASEKEFTSEKEAASGKELASEKEAASGKEFTPEKEQASEKENAEETQSSAADTSEENDTEETRKNETRDEIPFRTALVQILDHDCNVATDPETINLVEDGLRKCSNKGQFYQFFRRRMGAARGGSFYKSLRGQFDTMKKLMA